MTWLGVSGLGFVGRGAGFLVVGVGVGVGVMVGGRAEFPTV